MDLTVSGGLPLAPEPSMPSQGPVQYVPFTAAAQPAVAMPGGEQRQWQAVDGQQWPPTEWQQQQWPPTAWPQQELPPATGPGPAWAPAAPVALAAVAPVAPVVRRRSGSARAVDAFLVLSIAVAVAGVSFAIGRVTAPASTTGSAATRGTAGVTSGRNAGTDTGQGTTGQSGQSGRNAAVLPLASGAPSGLDQQQPAASAAPAAPGTGTGAGSGTGTGTGGRTGFAGRGAAGLTGTVAALGNGTITITTADGQTTEVATTDVTTYHQQVAATRDAVTVGSSVRLQLAGGFGGGFGGGQGGPAASTAPGAGIGVATLSASDVEVLLPTGTTGQGTVTPSPGTVTAGRTGFGGRGAAGLTGTVTAVGDGSITITTASGQSREVATTDTTTYHQQAAATRDSVTVGSSVRWQLAGSLGGLGGGQPGQGSVAASAAPGTGTGSATLSASDVEVLLPTGQ